ncbi:MAG TPA: chitobiase/beta-hexosaminidase C-terminal domain-containing protein [Candidatus Sphingobacterium stercoripullorum]|uniref:Chitobiase/beta-hexosaminidase C-terminal domain-containing protein n=1 Tax=Candidatus Sphingobacterium stercoripullorum TaxID=2838759 RepID=A0A9D1WAM8_9SPHI|nr:chitobiase/beta-hexosaminidase C-terminal domain-containing protein [Candidatus Sphingobacterium stercoripullorum]
MLFKDINYRVPSVGVKEENGMLLANSEIPNFTIYYTTDGKSPTINSSIYNAPITFEEGTTYKFVAIDKNNKRGRVSIYAK